MDLREFRLPGQRAPDAGQLDQESAQDLRPVRRSVLLANSVGNQQHLYPVYAAGVGPLSGSPVSGGGSSRHLYPAYLSVQQRTLEADRMLQASPTSTQSTLTAGHSPRSFAPPSRACSSPLKPVGHAESNNNEPDFDDRNQPPFHERKQFDERRHSGYDNEAEFAADRQPDYGDRRQSAALRDVLPGLHRGCPLSTSKVALHPPAISVEDVSLTFGRGAQQVHCLRQLRLHVEMGCIYALLGSSGCGKTSLLKIILNQMRPTAGEVRLFGYRTGRGKCGVPGNGVGYMPQEVALCGDLSIGEMLTYFGQVGLLSRRQIRQRLQELRDELNLPSFDQVIETLSGGQRRRVSLAVALMLRSRLLVLDEPTVGVDPVLRAHIWEMLRSRAEDGCTVLITTHYVEEARSASVVGFLREGRLLAEGGPVELQRRLGCTTLEQVFHRLCMQQLGGMDQVEGQFERDSQTVRMRMAESFDEQNEWNRVVERQQAQRAKQRLIDKLPFQEQSDLGSLSRWFRRLTAVTHNCWMLSLRRPGTIIAQYLLPVITTMLFCVCIGSTPNGIRIGLVSDEPCPHPAWIYTVLEKGLATPDWNASLDTLPDFIRELALHLQDDPGDPGLSRSRRAADDFIPLVTTQSTGAAERETATTLGSPTLVDITSAPKLDSTAPNVELPSSSPKPPAPSGNGSEADLGESLDTLPVTSAPVTSAPADDSTLEPVDEQTEPPPILYTEFRDACFAELFFEQIDNFVFDKQRFANRSEAIELTRRGELWGFLTVPADFSRATLARQYLADHSADINLADAQMRITSDLTDRVLVDTVQRSLAQAYDRFIRRAISRANQIHTNLTGEPGRRFNPEASRSPIERQPSVFGSDVLVSDFFGVRDFAAPGVLTVVAFSISFALTAFDLVIELEGHMLQRHLIAGVSNLQFVMGHCAARLPFTCTSGPLLLLLCVFTFELPCRGSFAAAALLLTLQSVCGMCQALLLSALCPNAAVCAAVSNGFLVLVFIISGVFWSVETLPSALRWFSRVQPTSIPCESLRGLLARGLPVSDPIVQLGFQITLAWSVVYFLAAVFVFHRRTKQ